MLGIVSMVVPPLHTFIGFATLFVVVLGYYLLKYLLGLLDHS